MEIAIVDTFRVWAKLWKKRKNAHYKRHEKKKQKKRQGGEKSSEVELDLSGAFPMGIMLKSGLDGEKEAHTIAVGNFKHQEGWGIYGQLPDYDELQGYDVGIDTDLSRIAEKIYANFHKPSWRT